MHPRNYHKLQMAHNETRLDLSPARQQRFAGVAAGARSQLFSEQSLAPASAEFWVLKMLLKLVRQQFDFCASCRRPMECLLI